MLIYELIFGFLLTLLVGGFVVYQFLARQEYRERYMSVISSGNASISEDNKEKRLNKQRADIARKLKEASAENNRKNRVSAKARMEQAGIEAPTLHYWLASVALAIAMTLLVSLTSFAHPVKLMLIFTAFAGLPRLILNIMAKRRQKKFMDEFADALDGIGRLLQSGIPMSEAIAMGAREFKGPIREEFSMIYDNQRIGIPLGEAALLMSKRIPLPEVHMFATALHIQSETGSSLSEVLDNLSSVIRARYKLKRKIKAFSSEAKSSAAIIAALPVLVMLGLYLVRPEYIGVMFEVPKGKVMLGGAGFWMFCGVMVMRQMINFRI